jgi:phosphatidylglycerol---prolipoprotein diacylglyceryl transferase
MLPVIHIGPAAIQASTLSILVALWLGSFVAEREFKKRGLRPDDAWSIVALGIATTFITARLSYVAQNWDVYASDWLQIFALTPGTLDLTIGGLFCIIAVVAYLQRHHLSIERTADAFSTSAYLALGILAFGQFLSGDGFGTPTDLPWSVLFLDDLRHPVQLYEILGLSFGALILIRMPSALIGVAWYAAVRVFVDGFRADTTIIGDGFRTSQIIALVVLVMALGVIARRTSHANQEVEHA